jgi:spore maturation protein CgeB
MIDSGHTFYPRGITALPIPTIFYAIDTHLAFFSHQAVASLFDLVFVAQKEFVEPLKRTGCKNVFWLPLACDSEIHRRYDLPKIYDVCFLGSLYPQRKQLLKRLSCKFKVYQGYKLFNELTRFYSQSKIVFNKSINNDLNMRIFEAMSSGSMLLTDKLINNGLEDLFRDRQHLVLYKEDNLEYLTEYYLAHESEREKIAACGRDNVLSNHTYEHRAKQVIDTLEKFILRDAHLRRKKKNELSGLARIWFFQSRFGKIFRTR